MVSPAAGIVQEYEIPIRTTAREAENEFIASIRKSIVDNGIEKPKGHTVSWHQNPHMEKHHFGRAHPMKPWRLTLTRGLIMSYGLHFAMDTYMSRKATDKELMEFHTEDYIDYLRTAAPFSETEKHHEMFNLGGEDCPIFEGLFEYCSMYAGASIDAARKLCNVESDIAINWSGGLHHAKKAASSGFCYMNDIVLAILQLLRYHPRVLYIDIDVHHGDGVEEAFWSSDRVMTLSFHKYDPVIFFPGTGGSDTTGPAHPHNPGAHHALNVPLNDGITDTQYEALFRRIVGDCVTHFKPTAIVLQCGADSLAGDRLGRFNLQILGHGACVSFCKSLHLPLLLVGGGGYTPRNVARAWCNETAIATDNKVSDDMPAHTPYRSHFRHDGRLYPDLKEVMLGKDPIPHQNSQQYLDNLVMLINEQLRYVKGGPSVQMKHVPPDLAGLRDDVEEELRELEEEGEARRKEAEEGLGSMGEY